MSWTAILQAIGALAALALAVWKSWYYFKGKRDERREALLRSAEKLAESENQDRKREELRVKKEREIADAGLDPAKHSKLLSSSPYDDDPTP